MTVYHELDGEHVCQIMSIDRVRDAKKRSIYFLRMEIVYGPYAGEEVVKEYRFICREITEHFKADMKLLGVHANNHEEMEEMMVLAFGKRVLVRMESNIQGFTNCRILEVIEGDIPPEDDDDWLLDFSDCD